MLQKVSSAGCLVLLMAVSSALEAGQSADPGELYECASPAESEATLAAMAICDATATSELSRRAEADNLQVREGAFVVELDPSGVAGVSGLQVGDVIYRVGGIDVTSADSAADQLTAIGTGFDTVVNFLRGGRPYRVKLRLN
jgi:hypothetical protein